MFRDGETTIKIKFSLFEGGGEALGAERKIVQNAVFRRKRHDNKILKVQILLSRNFVVMAQAPNCACNSANKNFPCRLAWARRDNRELKAVQLVQRRWRDALQSQSSLKS